jgi:hypothetical protein
MGIDVQDGSGAAMHLLERLPGASPPGIIAPNDSGQAIVEHDAVKDAGIDVLEPVTAWVRLATGEVVKSKPSPLMRHS